MKKSKLFKTICFSSLAMLMATTGVFAFAPLSNTSLSGNLNVSAQEQNFDLGLRPDTDPVVYVTESGLKIKKSNGKYTSTTTTTTSRGYTYTQDLTSFYYFTMGTFSGTIYTAKTNTDTYEVSNEPVNWLIIGRGEFNFYDDSPAGIAIKNESSKQEFAIAPGVYLPMDMQSIPEGPDGEIPDNCFLVLSEKLLGQMTFNANYTNIAGGGLYGGQSPYYYILNSNGPIYGNRYRYYGDRNCVASYQTWTIPNNVGGTLYNYVNSLFSKNNSTGVIEGDNKLGFTQAQANMVVPQQLYTYYWDNRNHLQETPSTDGGTYYTMFPLACRYYYSDIYQNFCIDDYLTSNSSRIATLIGSNTYSHLYWTRTGMSWNGAHITAAVTPMGDFTSDSQCAADGVRPAMVMRLQ